MDNKLLFQKKLVELLAICKENGNVIEKSEVEEFFASLNLKEEQMILVYDYLLAQGVHVRRYIKASHVVELTAEEKEYLVTYEEELKLMKDEGILAQLLPKIVSIAKEMNHQEVFLGDLIQEGNMGLMEAMSLGEACENELLEAAQGAMQVYLESQSEVKLQDKKMADKVNHLDEEIKKLTEEMGRKITIDELSQFIATSEEEIEDILRLAGEEVEDIDENDFEE